MQTKFLKKILTTIPRKYTMINYNNARAFHIPNVCSITLLLRKRKNMISSGNNFKNFWQPRKRKKQGSLLKSR